MSKPGPGFKELFEEVKKHWYYRYCDAELDFTEGVAKLCPGMDQVPEGENIDQATWDAFKQDLALKTGLTRRYIDRLMGGGLEHLELKQMAQIAFVLGKRLKITLV